MGFDYSLWVSEFIIKCRAMFFIDYIMGGCFYDLCFRVDELFLYVLLDEFSLTLFLAASVVKRYIRGGVFMHFKGTESQI